MDATTPTTTTDPDTDAKRPASVQTVLRQDSEGVMELLQLMARYQEPKRYMVSSYPVITTDSA